MPETQGPAPCPSETLLEALDCGDYLEQTDQKHAVHEDQFFVLLSENVGLRLEQRPLGEEGQETQIVQYCPSECVSGNVGLWLERRLLRTQNKKYTQKA